MVAQQLAGVDWGAVVARGEGILAFRRPYRWLSNFWLSPIQVWGRSYRSVEHFYQACKARSQEMHDYIAGQPTPADARDAGGRISPILGWDDIREPVMDLALEAKFAPGTFLAEKLLGTGDVVLVEGNTWGDTHWGVCRGVGRNRLGICLMLRRAILQGAEDPMRWVVSRVLGLSPVQAS